MSFNLSQSIILFAAFLLMWFLDFVNWVLYLIQQGTASVHTALWYFSLAVNFTFAVLFTYQGLRHSDMFRRDREKAKYQWSNLSPAQKEKYLKMLVQHMSSEKPHLTPSLTIHDLSQQLDIPHRCRSQVINESLGKIFTISSMNTV